MSTKNAERLMKIFKGLDDAYGCYEITGTSGRNSQKKSGNATTVSKPLTLDQWLDHVSGRRGLGVVPITRNNDCHWACLDIDSYDGFDHRELLLTIADYNLPITVVKSKSGGAHCFMFFKEAIPCIDVRQFLTKVSIIIGHAGCEVFPKQDKLLSNQDKGNWLNMPYYNTNERLALALHKKGLKELDIDEFIKTVDRESLTRDLFYDLYDNFTHDKAVDSSDEDMLYEAPPCIVLIHKNKIREGTRQEMLFHFGVYALKRWGYEALEDKLPWFNINSTTEPLPTKEINSIMRSFNKGKEYQYKCKGCAKDMCNAGVCVTRKYGIDSKDAVPKMENLIKIMSDPAIYFLDTPDGRLKLNIEELNNPKMFQKACLEQLNKRPPTIKDANWCEIVNNLTKNMLLVHPPKDTSLITDIMGFLNTYINTNKCDDKSVLKEVGGVYRHADDYCYFKLADLHRLMIKQGVIDKGLTKANLSLILDDNDIVSKHIRSGASVLYVRGVALANLDTTDNIDAITIEDCDNN